MSNIIKKSLSLLLISCLIIIGMLSVMAEDASAASVPFKNRSISVKSLTVSASSVIKVQSKKITGASGYQVYRATTKSGKYKRIYSGKARTYSDKTVQNGKLYYYKVRAYKTSGGKRIYTKLSAAKSRRAAAVSNGFSSISLVDDGTVNADIAEVTGATGYYIYGCDTATGKFIRLYETSADQRTVTFILSEKPPTYFFTVKPYVTVGEKIYIGKNKLNPTGLISQPRGIYNLTESQMESYLSNGGQIENPEALPDSLYSVYAYHYLESVKAASSSATLTTSQSKQFAFTTVPSSLDTSRLKITWTSDDSSIASVSSSGLISGVNPGKTTVYGTLSNGMQMKMSITVTMTAEEYKARFIKEMFRLVNEFRVENGVHALEYADYIQPAADLRAKEAIASRSMSHQRYDSTGALTRFNSVFSDLGLTRAVNAGAGENLAWSYYSSNPTELASDIFNSWKNSEGHRTNMLHTGYHYFATGVETADNGVYQYRVAAVQLFLFRLN